MKERPLGSKATLRTYLIERVGVVLEADELQAAANGASQWCRRLRELRQEEGWKISSHYDRSALKPGQYVLEESCRGGFDVAGAEIERGYEALLNEGVARGKVMGSSSVED